MACAEAAPTTTVAESRDRMRRSDMGTSGVGRKATAHGNAVRRGSGASREKRENERSGQVDCRGEKIALGAARRRHRVREKTLRARLDRDLDAAAVGQRRGRQRVAVPQLEADEAVVAARG